MMLYVTVGKESFGVFFNLFDDGISFNPSTFLRLLFKQRKHNKTICWRFYNSGTSHRCFDRNTNEYDVITQFVQNGDSLIINDLFQKFEDYFEKLIVILPIYLSSITIYVSELRGFTCDALAILKEKTHATIFYKLNGQINEFVGD